MRQKSGPPESPSERIVQYIRRATRKRHSPETKIRIVLDGLRGESNIAAGLSTAYVSEFTSFSDGLAFIKAFMHIKDTKLRRGITKLVEQIADRHKD